MSTKPLVNGKFLLKRIPGKGGWTYTSVPPAPKKFKKPGGVVKVKGTIDGFPLKQYHLMPMGNGNMFLPVKAEIRKKIKKQQGDYVQVILYPDNDPVEIPEELLECLQDAPLAFKFFKTLSDSEKKYYIQWIYGAKQESTRANRIVKAIDRLEKGEKFHGNQ
jgi:hypothetical protein